MSVRFGLELVQELQQSHPTLPIIGMSGEHFHGSFMLDAGAAVFLEKPLDVMVLRETLAAYVDVSSDFV